MTRFLFPWPGDDWHLPILGAVFVVAVDLDGTLELERANPRGSDGTNRPGCLVFPHGKLKLRFVPIENFRGDGVRYIHGPSRSDGAESAGWFGGGTSVG